MTGKAIAAALAAAVALTVETTPAGRTQSAWERLQFLVGTWDSSENTQLGPAQGSTSFTTELGGRVIVRRSFADYGTDRSRPRHDDLLVVYREAEDSPLRAIYFDSEGHVIHYAVSAPAENKAVFQSDDAGSPPGPRYRLSYERAGSHLNGVFDVAPPGGDYKTYLSWTSVKR